jgi:hypothetical protein
VQQLAAVVLTLSVPATQLSQPLGSALRCDVSASLLAGGQPFSSVLLQQFSNVDSTGLIAVASTDPINLLNFTACPAYVAPSASLAPAAAAAAAAGAGAGAGAGKRRAAAVMCNTTTITRRALKDVYINIVASSSEATCWRKINGQVRV